MKSIPLSNSGINVSALGFGAMYLGTRSSPETSFQLLDEYVDYRLQGRRKRNAHW